MRQDRFRREALHLFEHPHRSIAIEVRVDGFTQHFLATQEVEEAEFNVTEVGGVMAHGVMVLPTSNLRKRAKGLFFALER